MILDKLKIVRKDEWRDLEKFVSSPYFNKGRNYLPLLKILKEFYPEFNSVKLIRENIHRKLYKGKKYNENSINRVLSRLNSICEEFFLYQNFRKRDEREIRLLEEYSNRGYVYGSEKLSKSLKTVVDKDPEDYRDYLEKLNKLSALDSYYYTHSDKKKGAEIRLRTNRILIYFAMIDSFLLKGTVSYDLPRVIGQDFNTTFESKLLDSIDFERMLILIQKEDPGIYRILKFYHLTVKQISDIDNDQYFYELKDLIAGNINKLNPQLNKMIFSFLKNICIAKIHAGKKEFEYEIFKLAKQLLAENFNFFIETDSDGTRFFNQYDFWNTVSTGLSLNEIEWVEKFVLDYSPMLQNTHREPLKNFSLAKISFAKKKFNDALGFLGKVNTDNLITQLNIKKLTSMIYYETDSFVNLQSYLNAYYQTVNIRNKQNYDILLRHRNFVRYLRKLEHLRNIKRDYLELLMQKELLNKDNVSDKEWLLKKYLEAERELSKITNSSHIKIRHENQYANFA